MACNIIYGSLSSGGSREYSLYRKELPLLAGCLDFVIAALALRHNAKLPPVALHAHSITCLYI